MHVVVASKNPTKVNAVREAFTAVFFDSDPDSDRDTGGEAGSRRRSNGNDEALIVRGVSVDSGVADQPVGDEETRRGALNRAQAAQALHPDADFWVGVEGGVIWYPTPLTGAGQGVDELECMAWVMVLGADGRLGRARSNGFQLPPAMAELIRGGLPQNLADDQVFGRVDSGTTNGTVGYLSLNHVDRTHYTRDAVILALAPFLHPEHYPAEVRHPTEVTVQ